jgi:predicted alpha/beta hydrolase
MSMNEPIQLAQDFELKALDGYTLAATAYTPADPAGADPQYIVIGNATGVPRGFYRRFAGYAANRGIHVVSADYRGIGGSKHGSLRGFEMEYADWSRYDLAALVQWAAERGKVWLVGHSLAGHAIGQLPQPNVLQAAYVCAAGAGWHGWMPFAERIKVWLVWNTLAPVLTRIYGYHPMSVIGVGEDLPMGVYRDWKRWCHYPNYFFDDPTPRAKAIATKFKDVTIPIAAAVATDDLWAPPKSRDAFFQHYRGTHVDRIDLQPAHYGVKEIGHMGYFRAQVGEKLWPEILGWLQAHGLRVNDAA